MAQRIAAQDGARLARMLTDNGVSGADRWRIAIAPHDDYAYAGFMYPLAEALARIVDEDGLDWGSDIALLCSTDAVHYGEEGWDGRNFAYYGADEAGYAKALEHEGRILCDCFAGELSPERIERFTRYTVAEHDHREYQWTWCGRYSVPFGLLVAWHLARIRGARALSGTVLGYATSLGDQRIEVADLEGMDVTAPASLRHWVGYAAVGYV